MLTREDSDRLNAAIEELSDSKEYTVHGLSGTGKCVPYIGWYWREVDFTVPLSLGWCGGGCPPFAGFMENNKWDYFSWSLTVEQSEQVVAALQRAVAEPSDATLQAAFDVIQSCLPADKAHERHTPYWETPEGRAALGPNVIRVGGKGKG